MVLDQFSGQNQDCWPSISLIAQCAEISERQVRRSIAHLVAQGLLTYKDEKMGVHSRVYWIQYPAIAKLHTEQELAAATRERGASPPPGAGPKKYPGLLGQDTRPNRPGYPGLLGNYPGLLVPQNKQTNSSVEYNKNTVGVFCPPGSEGDKEALHRIRNLTLAQSRLIGAGVWKTQIPRLLEIAGAEHNGNPLPRVIEVCERAEAKGHSGAWIKTAIEEGWSFKPKRRRRKPMGEVPLILGPVSCTIPNEGPADKATAV